MRARRIEIGPQMQPESCDLPRSFAPILALSFRAVTGLAGALQVLPVESSFWVLSYRDAMIYFHCCSVFAVRLDLTDWVFSELQFAKDLPGSVVAAG